MGRLISELANHQVDELMGYYVASYPDGRSTAESTDSRARQLDADITRRRIDLGLTEHEAGEMSVVVEFNRRRYWAEIAAARSPAAPQPAQPATEGIVHS